MTRFWINTVSLEHVEAGVRGGFTQADHGRSTRLSRLQPGDRIAFYSPRREMRSGEAVQRFTALGTITTDEPYQVTMRPDFRPWRHDVDFVEVSSAEVRPLLDRLSFVTDAQPWGMAFRRGLFEVSAEDFRVVEEALRHE